MPLKKSNNLGQSQYFVPESTQPQQSILDNAVLEHGPMQPAGDNVLAAAFRVENDVVAAYSLLTKKRFEPDYSFDLSGKLKENGLWDDYRDMFVGVESEAEYMQRLMKLQQEERDRKLADNAGFAGFLSYMAAGITSPVSLLPFTGGAKGAKAAATGAGWGLVGGVLQEAPLQADQYTRSGAESGMSIGASVIAGGVLGGAYGFMTRKEIVKANEAIIKYSKPNVGPAAGSDVLRTDAGGFKSAAGTITAFSKISPVTRVINGPSKQGRWMMSQLADAGLEREAASEGIVATPGNTVENIVNARQGDLVKVLDFADEQFQDYWYAAREKPRIAASLRATIGSTLSKFGNGNTRYSRKEFNEEIGRALFSGDKHPVPQVQKAAENYRKNLLEPLERELEDAGLLTKEMKEAIKDPSFFHRIYDHDKLVRYPAGFIRIVKRHAEIALETDFEKAYQAFYKKWKRKWNTEDAKKARQEFTEMVREKYGADEVDLKSGQANFSRYAEDIARSAKDKILGTNIRTPGLDILAETKGPLMARSLAFASKDLFPYLVLDAEKVASRYHDTMVPEIELTRKFGPMLTEGGEMNLAFRELNEEQGLAQIELQKELEAKLAKKEITEAQYNKQMDALEKQYADIRRDLQATVARLRHEWGLPSNPDGMAHRLGRATLQLSSLRLLGGVALNSFPDLAKPVMRYGLGRTFKSSWVPYASRLVGSKTFAKTKREARLAGVSIETVRQQRANALLGILDDVGKRNKFEQGLEFANSRMGIIAAFSMWTDFAKQLSFAAANAEFMDSMLLSIGKAKGSAAEVKKATTMMRRLNITDDDAKAILAELEKEGGGDMLDGVWLPNTEAWEQNGRALRAYRSAMNAEASSSIVTPGLEKPLSLDANMGAKLLFQLKPFIFSSTQRTLMAGLQQRDIALVQGVVLSLALGGMMYYVNGVLKGGRAYEEVKNADWRKWADEAIDRSGILGVISLAQGIGQNIPVVDNVMSLSGKRLSRRNPYSLVGEVLGPNFDAFVTAASILQNVDDFDRSSLHKLRSMMPLQNIFYLRRLFDLIENATGDVFGLEGDRR